MKTNKLFLLLSFLSFSFAMWGQTVVTVQGEAFTSSSNGSTATTTSGYRGTGYATVSNVTNYLEWNNVTVSTAGYYSLRFRYRNNTAAFTSSLSVNSGTAVSLNFASTTVWSNSIESTIYLAAGANTVRLSNINHTSSLLDELTFTSITVVSGEDFTSGLNGSTATTTVGYNGTGYALMANAANNYIEWNNITVNALQGAFVAIQFRYISSSATAQNCAISVNGTLFQNYNFTQATSWSNSKVITVYLPAGANTLRLTANNATNNVSPLIDELKLTELSSPVYQAENATSATKVEASNWAGFTGTGFMSIGGAAIEYLELNNVYAPAATTATLKIRYAVDDASGGRACDLYVNGTLIQSLAFVDSYWNDWRDQTSQSISLNAGLNTIKFVVNNSVNKGPNLDQLEWISTLTTAIIPLQNEKISLFVNNQNQIVIRDNEGAAFEIFNVMGQQINHGVVRSNYYNLPSKLTTGIYIVKTGNKSQKVIIH